MHKVILGTRSLVNKQLLSSSLCKNLSPPRTMDIRWGALSRDLSKLNEDLFAKSCRLFLHKMLQNLLVLKIDSKMQSVLLMIMNLFVWLDIESVCPSMGPSICTCVILPFFPTPVVISQDVTNESCLACVLEYVVWAILRPLGYMRHGEPELSTSQYKARWGRAPHFETHFITSQESIPGVVQAEWAVPS